MKHSKRPPGKGQRFGSQRSGPRPTVSAPISGPPLDLRIDSVGGEGDGVGKTPDGKTIYAPFALPGEMVRVIGGGERRELDRVLVPSAERVEPPCPHFGVCGGCALQHWEAKAYLAWKVERLRGIEAQP